MLTAVVMFLVACLLVAMVPGPSTAVILRQAVVEGRRSAIAATLGNETGLLLWAVAAAFGITALITASELAYDALRVVGGVVLVVMGVQALRRARRITASPSPSTAAGGIDSADAATGPAGATTSATAGGAAGGEDGCAGEDGDGCAGEDGDAGGREGAGPVRGRRRGGAWRSYRLGVLTAVANAKAGVFAMAFLPQFVPDGVPALPVLLGLTVVWGLVDIAWYGLLIWLAGRARDALSRPAAQRLLERISGGVLVALGIRLAAEAR